MIGKPLCAGDKVRLVAPAYGEPPGECVVIASQKDNLVWFTAVEGVRVMWRVGKPFG